MKDELQSKMVEILTSIQSAAGKASDFALEQLPDIAQQYVLYGRGVTVATSVFLLLLAIGFGALALWAYRNPWNISDWSVDKGKARSDSNLCVMGFGALFSFVLLMVSFASFDWMVWLAPKVWLLKELASLIK